MLYPFYIARGDGSSDVRWFDERRAFLRLSQGRWLGRAFPGV